MLHKIRLLIFDLDYLTFDCASLKERALRQSLIPFADQIPTDCRLPDAVDIENGFRDFGTRWIHSLELGLEGKHLQALEEAYQAQEIRLVESGIGRFFAGIKDLVLTCKEKGLSAALGAEARMEYLLSICDRHGMDRLFEMAVCTEEYGMGGADEMFVDIMSHQEVNPSETLVLGTRASYFAAGHAIDVLSIGCGWGLHQGQDLSAADFQSLSLAHLYPLIQQADALAVSHSG